MIQRRICAISNARPVGCRSVTLLDYSFSFSSHWETQHTHTCTHAHAHTHTHTHTHAHTHTFLQHRKCTKASTKCTTSRHYHLYTKFANSCGYSRLRSCFFQTRSSELWASYLCRRFQSEIARTKACPRYRHLPNLSVCDSRHSPTSVSLLSLFRGNDVKAFKTPAIEEDAGTKTASDGALSDRILRKWLARRWTGHLYRVKKPPSEK